MLSTILSVFLLCPIDSCCILKQYTKKEFIEQLFLQYKIELKENSYYNLEILPEWVNWVRRRFDYGYPINLYNGVLKRRDGSCLLIFGPSPDSNSSRTSMRKEVFDVFEKDYMYPNRKDGDTTIFIVTPTIPDSFNTTDYTYSLHKQKRDLYTIHYFRVPENSSACFLNGYDNQESIIQVLHENEYPVIYRVFIFVEGKQVFDLLMLLSNKAAKFPKKYFREIKQLFYFPTE